jgi:hypothetical protein
MRLKSTTLRRKSMVTRDHPLVMAKEVRDNPKVPKRKNH